MKPLVLISQPLPLEKDHPAWKELHKLATVKIRKRYSKTKLINTPGLKKAAAVISLVSDPIDQKFLNKAPNLKIISNCAVGYNNIDLDQAKRRKIVVSNTPDVLTNATAEFTLALILGAARNFKEGLDLINKKKYKGWVPDLLLGRDLKDSTLGIVGFGRIGQAVAKKAKALGMNVLFTDVNPKAGSVSLEKVLARSDFVSIHCPLTEKTNRLFKPKTFSKMKKGAYLINTSRGEIVDEKALIEAINRNKIAGAALDVFRNEPKLNASLRAHPKILVLPHLGSATKDSRAGMARLAIEAVNDVLAGRAPKNRVT